MVKSKSLNLQYFEKKKKLRHELSRKCLILQNNGQKQNIERIGSPQTTANENGENVGNVGIIDILAMLRISSDGLRANVGELIVGNISKWFKLTSFQPQCVDKTATRNLATHECGSINEIRSIRHFHFCINQKLKYIKYSLENQFSIFF